jgi:hypothetical protein
MVISSLKNTIGKKHPKNWNYISSKHISSKITLKNSTPTATPTRILTRFSQKKPIFFMN